MDQEPLKNQLEDRMTQLLAEVARQDSEWQAVRQQLENADPRVVVAYDELPSFAADRHQPQPFGIRV